MVKKLMSKWTIAAPFLAVILLAFTWGKEVSTGWLIVVAVLLIAAVLAAVHHAESIAYRIGEPFGSLVLAVAVTVIEVGLIVMLMLAGKSGAETLARDSIFAVAMMTMNGIVGVSLFIAAQKSKSRFAIFNAEGSASALSAALLLSGLTLVLPRFTMSTTTTAFSSSQLIFVGCISLLIYGLVVFTQTVRHREQFLAPESDAMAEEPERDAEVLSETLRHDAEIGLAEALVKANGTATVTAAASEHAAGKTAAEAETSSAPVPAPAPAHPARDFLIDLGLLLVALVGVVGLAKVGSPGIEAFVAHFNLPQAVVGVIIALLILLPETIAAIKYASRGKTQISLNLAYGSAMASIGLTIPVLALISFWLPSGLMLGLDPLHIVLLGLTAVVSILTIVPGRSKTLNGGLHLALFAAFLFLTIVP